MAKTGIKITTIDTVLGAPIDVNTTSMIISCYDSTDPTSGRSPEDFASALGGNTMLREAVSHYYSNPSNRGKLLWVADIQGETMAATAIVEAVRSTVADSFDNRPRQIAFIASFGSDATELPTASEVSEALSKLSEEGIRCVAVLPDAIIASANDLDIAVRNAVAVTAKNAPFVGACIAVNWGDGDSVSHYGAVDVVSALANVSVGTSIGDGGLTPVQSPECILVSDTDSDYQVAHSVRNLSLSQIETLGEKGYLFTRTRPPRNGLWWNDGATCNDPANALSTLEAGRTICAMADDLQSFFVPYINTRVPVTSTGDIQSAYKQVVLDNARAAVVQKYIENGDISDARINLVAKNNDMIGTRTWEVTLSILPAPTLRWIDGYVFYVKSL